MCINEINKLSHSIVLERHASNFYYLHQFTIDQNILNDLQIILISIFMKQCLKTGAVYKFNQKLLQLMMKAHWES